MSQSVAAMLFLAFLTASCLIVSLPVNSGSKTIIVPDDYPTISSAIDNATDGDIILVKEGVYEEKPLEINKTLSIIGEDPASTIIKVNAPIINVTQILSQIYTTVADAIIINANGVKLSSLTIVTGGNIIAIGDRTQIIGNNLASGSTEKGLVINGSYCNVTENIMQTHFTGGSVSSLISVDGSFNAISQNSAYKIIITRDSNIISYNTINSIQMLNANNNVVYGNNISTSTISTRTADHGVLLVENSAHNIIYNNNVLALLNGVEINSKSAENNTFYHNNFLIKFSNEPVSVYTYNLTLFNFWDNGEEGNYWEDYNGTDANRDGIGDTPYVIDADNVDHYPLMFPYDVEKDTVVLPPPEPFPTELVIAAVAVVAVVSVCVLVYFRKRKR